MLGVPFFRRAYPVLAGERVLLRFPRNGDFAEWAALRAQSRSFLEPWEPLWAPDELERSAWRTRLRRYRGEFAEGTAVALFIFDATDRLLGGITLGNVRRGVSQSGHIGYWMGERHAGKGLMPDAVNLLCRYAFDTLKLHRIEAACIPDNLRSRRVLEKVGFQQEGLLRSYLRIHGRWHDHTLYALLSDDPRGSGTKG